MEEASRSKKPASFWFFASGTALLFVLLSALVILPLTSGHHLGEKALAQGQRAIITFKTGAVDGKIYKAPPVIAAPSVASSLAKPDTAATQTVTTAPELKTDVKPETPVAASTPEKKPAPVSVTLPRDLDAAQDKIFTIPQFSRSSESLALAPSKTLVETVGDITLPIKDKEGTAPWDYYAKPVTLSKRPKLAIVVTGLGLSRTTTNDALNIPSNLTMSFSPYAKDTPLWVINARNRGFESWLDLPVQPSDYPASDPGPYALLDDNTLEENIKRLQTTLSRFQGFSGVVVPSYEKFTVNPNLAIPIVQELSRRGVQMVYASNPSNTDFIRQTDSSKLLTLTSQPALDERLNQEELIARIQSLIAIAKKDGTAVGMLRAYPASLQVMKQLPELMKDSGVDLVPLSAIAKARQ